MHTASYTFQHDVLTLGPQQYYLSTLLYHHGSPSIGSCFVLQYRECKVWLSGMREASTPLPSQPACSQPGVGTFAATSWQVHAP